MFGKRRAGDRRSEVFCIFSWFCEDFHIEKLLILLTGLFGFVYFLLFLRELAEIVVVLVYLVQLNISFYFSV
jgi:hypothetical protein